MQRLNEWESAFVELQKICFAYAAGQRDAERAGHEVESAGAALERADRAPEASSTARTGDKGRTADAGTADMSYLWNGSGSWMALRWDGD